MHFLISFYQQPSKDWAKRIQHEWKVLEKDLPGKIVPCTDHTELLILILGI